MDDGTGKGTWWVYMLACRGGKIYTGTAIDPEARFLAHREGKGAAFTRANPPVAILRRLRFESRQAACRAEAALKKLSHAEKLSWTREKVKKSRESGVKKEECAFRGKKG